MKGKQIAICDREPEYAFRFAEYAGGQLSSLFSVHGFSGKEELLNYTEDHPVDISLLSAELWEPEMKKMEKLGQIYLLEEGEYRKEETEYPGIYKYQSCPRILSSILDSYAEASLESMGRALKTGRMKRIGVYSPIGRQGQTQFSLALGKELSRKKRTLYLNLEEYSGFETLYPYGDGWTLSELMYFLKQGKNAFACKLEGMVQKLGGLDYIPPLKSPVELRYISGEDWELLLEALERESLYELVILDLSGVVNGLFELLERCERIYMPVAQDETARAKLEQYEASLRLLGLEEILEKTKTFPGLDPTVLTEFVQSEGKRWDEREM